MNETLQTIFKRRSCRSFSEKPVSKDDVNILLDCALASPSGMNRQTWQFTAVVNPAKIQKLALAVGKALGRDSGYDMYKPQVLIITSNSKDSAFKEVDNACAMQNIYLASTSLGLGCVWINQLKDCFDVPEVRSLLTEFGIPENHGVYGSAAIGYANAEPRAKDVVGIKKIVD